MHGFVMLRRSEETIELMKYPPAFILLTQIALRARRTNTFNTLNLKMGEALLGDCKSIGLTEQQYRTAKKKLANWSLATFRATNKGTVATICNKNVYDINIIEINEQNNTLSTIKQQAGNVSETTNKKENKFKNYKNNLKKNRFEFNKNTRYENGL